MRRWTTTLTLTWVVSLAGLSQAGTKRADPSTYQAIVPTLAPGDTLELAAGDYGLLSITGLNGTAASWIVIQGPEGGGATFHADPGPCCNTVEIADASYVALV